MIWVESAWPVDGTRVHWTHKHHRVRLTRPYWVALIHSSPLHSADKFCYQDSSTLTRSHLCQNLITILEKGKGTRERGSSCSSMATEEQVHALKDMLRELVNYCGEWWLHRMRHGCSFCSQGFEMHHFSLSQLGRCSCSSTLSLPPLWKFDDRSCYLGLWTGSLPSLSFSFPSNKDQLFHPCLSVST